MASGWPLSPDSRPLWVSRATSLGPLGSPQLPPILTKSRSVALPWASPLAPQHSDPHSPTLPPRTPGCWAAGWGGGVSGQLR